MSFVRRAVVVVLVVPNLTSTLADCGPIALAPEPYEEPIQQTAVGLVGPTWCEDLERGPPKWVAVIADNLPAQRAGLWQPAG